MLRKIILPILAFAGVVFAIIVAIRGARTIPPARPVSEPPVAAFPLFVAGSGMVEASSENIAIGTQIAGVVSQVYVQVGSHVQAGEPLFTIDDRAQLALLNWKRSAVQVANASLEQASYERGLSEGLTQKGVVSLEDREMRRYAVQTAEAQKALAQAEVNAAATDLERLTVRAPFAGDVLQLKIHPGEFAPTGILPQPLLVLGSVLPLNVRVDVDENDAWRVRAGATAVGYLRGNKDINVPLKFVRFEPYVVPKVSLTGQSTERVDTRVLQVIFSFERGEKPIFVGQQMDIVIDAGERAGNEMALGKIRP